MKLHLTRSFFAFLVVLTSVFLAVDSFAQIQVVSTTPQMHALDVPRGGTIAIQFSESIAPSSVTSASFFVRGEQTGRYDGATEVVGDEIRYTPNFAFKEGEIVFVHATNQIAGAVSGAMLADGYILSFHVRPEFGTREFQWQDAGFVSPVTIGLEPRSGPVDITFADLNTDGRPELIVVKNSSSRVAVFTISSGSQSIYARVADIPVGEGPRDVQVADVTGDGLPDLIVANMFGDSIELLTNTGNFTFSAQRISTANRPRRSVISDFNADGRLDIAVLSFGDDLVSILTNTGGSYSLGAQIPVSSASIDLEAADFDRDGRTDLAVLSAGMRRVEWYSQDGSGTWQLEATKLLGLVPEDMAIGDFLNRGTQAYGDGLLDVVVVGQNQSGIRLIPGGLNWSFGATESLPIPGTSPEDSAPGRVVVADVDTTDQTGSAGGLGPDADLEAIFTQFGDDRLGILPNMAGQGYSQSTWIQLQTIPTPMGVAAGDAEGDGDVDIAITGFASDVVQVFFNRGGRDTTGVAVRFPYRIIPDPLSFGNVYTCEDSTRTFQAGNIGNVELEIRSIDDGASSAFVTTLAEPLSHTLRPGETVDGTVTFSPIAPIVVEDSTLHAYTFSGTDEFYYHNFSGTGIETNLTSTPIDFGDVIETTNSTEDLLIQNTGNTESIITGISFSNPVFETTSTTPIIIQAGGQRTIPIRFSPTAEQNYSGSVTFTTNDPCNPVHTVALTGTGTNLFPDIEARSVDTAEISDVILTRPVDLVGDFEVKSEHVAQSFAARILVDGVVVREKTFGPLVEGTVDTVRTTHTFTTLGAHTVRFEADFQQEVFESDEENNDIENTIVVVRGDMVTIRPNPFTPNNDGFNDRLEIEFGELGLSDAELAIFTLEGRELVTFNTGERISYFWNGQDDAGNDQPAGVYLYVLKDGSTVHESGHVTLAR